MKATYLEYHLGDNLVHLNYIRRVVENDENAEFVHYCNRWYIPQLKEMLEGTGIALADISYKPDTAINVWKNCYGDFYHDPLRDDWLEYHIKFFKRLSKDLGVVSPMREAKDFLMDCPRILKNKFDNYDVLYINSNPMSGQLRKMNGIDVDMILEQIIDKGKTVITTAQNRYGVPMTGLSLMDIGGLSLTCKNIIGIATGPMWPCLNVWNDEKYKLWFLDNERVNISPNTDHASSYKEARDKLEARGLI